MDIMKYQAWIDRKHILCTYYIRQNFFGTNILLMFFHQRDDN